MSLDIDQILSTKLSSNLYEFVGYEIKQNSEYIPLNSIVYSLSIGFGNNIETYNDDLKFIYEGDNDFMPFPTHIGSYDIGNVRDLLQTPTLSHVHRSNALHSDQITEFYHPVKIGTKIKTKWEVVDVDDRGHGGVITIKLDYMDEIDENLIYASVYQKTFLVGHGGFGHKGSLKQLVPKTPDRDPWCTLIVPTSVHQAALYRLVGDDNPLHIDPEAAKVGQFERPILHGMCTYGTIARAIYQKYCNQDPSLIKKYHAKFTSYVYPGETFSIDCYKEGTNIIFEAKTIERGLVVAKGYIQLRLKAKI